MLSSKKAIKYLLYIAISTLVACGSSNSDSPKEASDGVSPIQKPAPGEGESARGMINGKPWVYRQGIARKVVYRGTRFYEIQLWDQIIANPCSGLRGSNLQVRLHADSLSGDWVLGADSFALSPRVVLSDFAEKMSPANNMISNKGAFRLQFDQTNNEVLGSFIADFPDDMVDETWAAGEFAVTLCGSR